MVRACVGIVAVLLVAACGQRGPLVLPQAARGAPAPQAPAGVPEPFLHSAPLSPAISDSPDPTVSTDAFGGAGR